MPFNKKNQWAYNDGAKPKDAKPLSVRLYEGDTAKLKEIEGWQDKVRDAIRAVIEAEKES
jgi:uncharacterized protein (DUF4415 family)